MFHCQIIDPLPERVRGDERRIRQVFINLLSNAIKFTSEGEITFRISYRSEVAKFQIIDSGEGIEATELENIFLPFTRLSKSTGNAIAGSGLGLTISKIITQLMGGEITVVSMIGEGSTFSVRFLLSKLKNSNKPYLENNVIRFNESSKNILVVDDQYEQRNLISTLLEPLGFIVDQATSGNECLIKVNQKTPDLIFMDLAMEDMGGLEASRNLRQQNYSMPIVVISANAYPSDQQNAENAGVMTFLKNPLKSSIFYINSNYISL